MHNRQMRNIIPTLPIPTLGLLLGLAGCVTPPVQTTVAPPVYPTPARIAAGQTVNLASNEPMGQFGTRAILTEAPGCSTVRLFGDSNVRLGEQLVTPVLAQANATCPDRNARSNTPYLAMNRAVLLDNGLYTSNATQECFLPNAGGGNCRPVSR